MLTDTTVNGQIVIASRPLAIQANRKVRADIDHIAYKLLDATTLAQVGPTVTVFKATQPGNVFGAAITVQFQQVPNGTFRMSAEAFDTGGSTISQNGTVAGVPIAGTILSTNTVTVAAGQTPPVSGTLTLTLNLLDATGETVDTAVTVTNGQALTGVPVGSL